MVWISVWQKKKIIRKLDKVKSISETYNIDACGGWVELSTDPFVSTNSFDVNRLLSSNYVYAWNLSISNWWKTSKDENKLNNKMNYRNKVEQKLNYNEHKLAQNKQGCVRLNCCVFHEPKQKCLCKWSSSAHNINQFYLSFMKLFSMLLACCANSIFCSNFVLFACWHFVKLDSILILFFLLTKGKNFSL